MKVVVAIAASLSAATCGCGTLFAIEGGPVIGLSSEKQSTGAMIAGHAGIALYPPDVATTTIGADAMVRAKASGSSQSLAFGPGAYLALGNGSKFVDVRVGGHLNFERFDDTLLVGAGPHASANFSWSISERSVQPILLIDKRTETLYFTLGPALEVNPRISRPGGTSFIGFNAGLAWATE